MISCEQHDYIEIVCTYCYPIALTLKTGAVIECIAVDTARDDNKFECIKVVAAGVERLVVLEDIAVLTARIDNPHITSVSFT